MQEQWHDVPGFDGYAVSSHGRVRSRAGRVLTHTFNQQGHEKVNLSIDGRTVTRSVAGLVARAFIEPPLRRDFNTIIHLDGDKNNAHADNLMWRPRYFAIRYHKQFESTAFRETTISVKEMKTGEEFASIHDAAVKFGLLYNDILVSAHERTFVWPTFQEFRVIS